MLFCQDGIVDAASFVPNRIALSSAESEYNEGAFGVTAAQHVRQCWDSVIHGLSHYRIKHVLDRRNKMCSSSLTHREMRSERTFWIQEPLPIQLTSF
jgi:hypothetical protein